MKIKQARKALASTLRLLAMLRESLAVEGATNTPLGQSIGTHCQMIGQLLPDEDRLSKEELTELRRRAAAVKFNEQLPENGVSDKKIIVPNNEKTVPNLPGTGQFQILGGVAGEQIKRRI